MMVSKSEYLWITLLAVLSTVLGNCIYDYLSVNNAFTRISYLISHSLKWISLVFIIAIIAGIVIGNMKKPGEPFFLGRMATYSSFSPGEGVPTEPPSPIRYP